jgi:hypothetical protein
MGFQMNCQIRRVSAAFATAVAMAATGLVLSAASPNAARAQGAQGAQGVLRGYLYDDATGTPIRGTVMLVDPASDAAVMYKATDSLGQFSLEAGTGIYRIAAIHPGWKSVLSAPISLRSGERLTIRVPIAAAGDPSHHIGVLEHIQPTGSGGAQLADLDGMGAFRSRKALGTGLHYERAQFDRSRVSTLGEFLQTVPGLSVVDPSSTSSMQLMRNSASAAASSTAGMASSTCHLGWFLDGHRMDIPGISDGMTDRLGTLQLDGLEGVEVFRGLSEMPAQFASPDLRCGAVAIWSRRG